MRAARVTITNTPVVPYNRQPTSADHHRQDTPCYQDEALLLLKYLLFVVRLKKKKKNKAAMLVPRKEASGQDGLHRLTNSVVPAPEKNPLPPKAGLLPNKRPRRRCRGSFGTPRVPRRTGSTEQQPPLLPKPCFGAQEQSHC